MVFSAQEYLDKEFFNIQEFMQSLMPTLPIIDAKKIKDEKQLIKALVTQNKGYSRQIISLMETLVKGPVPTGGPTQQKSRVASPSQKERKSHSQPKAQGTPSQKEDPSKSDEANKSHLERKIEYLNNLVMESKHTLEERDYEYGQLKNKHEQLVEEYKKVVSEKEKIDQDLQELISEYSEFREKYEVKFQEIIASKDTLISDLKRKLELRGLSPSKNGQQTRISERDEELEELREKLEHKDKLLAEIRTRSPTRSPVKDTSSNSGLSYLNDRLIQLGVKIEDFYALFVHISRKLSIHMESEKNFAKKLEFEEPNIDKWIKSINNEFIPRLESLKFYADKVLDRLADRENLTDVSISQSRTPSKNPLRENIHVVKDEIEETLKTTFTALEKSSKEELHQQLILEMEKNADLQRKIEFLNRLVHKINFIIQEETERLTWVYDYSAKTNSIHELRGQIDSCKRKLSDLLVQHGIGDVNISSEYTNQKLQWEDRISHQNLVFNQELTKLRNLLDSEKSAYEKVAEKLRQERDRLKDEMVEAERFFKNELEKQMKKLVEYEGNNMDLNQENAELKSSYNNLERRIAERENTIHHNSTTIAQLQKKNNILESENQSIQNQLSKNKNILNDREREVDHLTKEIRRNEEERRVSKEQIEKLQNRIRDTEHALDHERRILKESQEELTREYRNYVSEAETHCKEIKENSERIVRDYSSQVDDLKSSLEHAKRNHQKQLKIKDDEILQLEELKRSNQDLLRNKDVRISELSEEIRSFNTKLVTLEGQLSEMNILKDKNRKYVEHLQTSNSELNNLKLEVQNLIHDKSDFASKNAKLEREYNLIREDLRKQQEKYNESVELVDQHRSEIKMLKHELDIAHEKISLQVKEAKEHEQTSFAQSQSQISYKDEIITKLKNDMKHLTSEYELVKNEYQRIIERNEETLVENRKLRNIVREHSLELEMNLSNEKLFNQSEALRQELLRPERPSISTHKKVRDFETLLTKGDNLQK